MELLFFPENIVLGRMRPIVANTLAYYSAELITFVKKFIVQALDDIYGNTLKANHFKRGLFV
jgi:hypothetical protein